MYKSKRDLPETLKKHLPENLQEIYLGAYQKSWQEYEDYRGGEGEREMVAHRDAMKAVRLDHVFVEETGKWYRRGEQPEDSEQDEGFLDKLKGFVDELR